MNPLKGPLFTCLACIFIAARLTWADDRKPASQIIRERGFNLDEFDVISQGVYQLKVYRIINPLADPKTLHRIPVVAAHGVGMDMANMMAAAKFARPRKPRLNERVTLYAMENGTDDQGLYFYLSNNNYDVWLLEARGTDPRYTKALKPEDGKRSKAFWDFSIDEQALIDLPTQIEFVLMKTGSKQVAYIAFSQTTLFMFCLLSMEPEYSQKLAAFIAMAPVFYGIHYRGLVWPSTLARLYFGSLSSANPFLPRWFLRAFNFISSYSCSVTFFRETLCRGLWRAMGGPDKHLELKGGLIEDMSKPTSFKVFEQFARNGRMREFRMYDYKDEKRNMEEYGQAVPPKYNISKINARNMVFFRGINDYLSDAQDQMILINQLKVPLYEDHVLEEYGHMDFISSATLVKDVNEPILRVLDKLTNRTVDRVVHTLGNPNPEVVGTPMVIDLKNTTSQQNNIFADTKKSTNGVINNDRALIDFKSVPEAEKPKDGVKNVVSKSIREQIFGDNKQSIQDLRKVR